MILFDLDGTLIDAADAQSRAYTRALSSVFGLDRRLEDVPHHGATMRMILTMILGTPVTAAQCETFAAAHAAALEDELLRSGIVIPGAAACLRDLRARGEHVGVITGNSAAATSVALRHFGLAEFLETGFYGDAADSRTALVADALGTHPHPVIVGDTPLDISAAHQCGCVAVGVATGRFSEDELARCGPELLLPTLGDAAELLASLRASARTER